MKIIEKAHGNVETREYLFSNDIDWLYNKKDWAGIKQLDMPKELILIKMKKND